MALDCASGEPEEWPRRERAPNKSSATITAGRRWGIWPIGRTDSSLLADNGEC